MNTILLKGDPLQKEALATSVAITPGYLLERSGAKVQAHSTAGGSGLPMFAVERAMLGEDIDDDIPADEQVIYHVARTGDEVYAMLADGHNVSVGAALESAGDGTLQPFATAADAGNHDNVIAYAKEAVDTSGSPTATARITVEAA